MKPKLWSARSLKCWRFLTSVGARVRDQEGRRDRLARAGRRVRHHVAIRGIELHVVLLSDGADRLLEDGLGRDVGDPPTAQVDTRGVLLQGVDVVLSASSWHAVGPPVHELSRAACEPAAAQPFQEMDAPSTAPGRPYGNAATRMSETVPTDGTYAYGGYPNVDALYKQQAPGDRPAQARGPPAPDPAHPARPGSLRPIWEYIWFAIRLTFSGTVVRRTSTPAASIRRRTRSRRPAYSSRGNGRWASSITDREWTPPSLLTPSAGGGTAAAPGG